ncbi:putative mitochondrial protein AtMg00300 [Bidens hawaiensis]|uniref:putative mitochondrial protein AtMg00300 n=1 Tax=Bidens hawaiensis TaxID=980011 RepID=UPI0040497FA8
MEDLGEVKLGDDRPCKIVGVGTVVFRLKNGRDVDIHNVRYIPTLTISLMSLGTFEKAGYQISLKDGKAKVIKGSLVVLTGTRRENNTYLLDGSVVVDTADVAVSKTDSALLWHKRFGHLSEQGLVELRKQQIIDEFKVNDVGFCETCVLGKKKKVQLSKGIHSTRGILDYVHSDLWGPARVNTIGGARYFLSIIDDYSRRVWVYVIKHKSDAFAKFVEWKTLVETQTEKRLKKLRTDNG